MIFTPEAPTGPDVSQHKVQVTALGTLKDRQTLLYD